MLIYSIIYATRSTFEAYQGDKKLKIIIITAENRNDPYIGYHDSNFAKYARTNGYYYSRTNNCSISVATTYWCKIHKVKELLEDTNDYDYIMWADSDTIITSDTPLESYLSKFGNKDIIIGVDCKTSCKKNHEINAGVFMVRKNQTGIDFINDCIKTLNDRPYCIKNGKEQGEWAGECYEQGIMNELVFGRYHKYSYVDYKSELIYSDWANGYIDVLKKDKKPLIMHLCGIPNHVRANIFEKYS